jgi:hypothetical protein
MFPAIPWAIEKAVKHSGGVVFAMFSISPPFVSDEIR